MHPPAMIAEVPNATASAPEAQRLRVDPVADPAHQHDLDVLAAPDLLQRVDRFDAGIGPTA